MEYRLLSGIKNDFILKYSFFFFHYNVFLPSVGRLWFGFLLGEKRSIGVLGQKHVYSFLVFFKKSVFYSRIPLSLVNQWHPSSHIKCRKHPCRTVKFLIKVPQTNPLLRSLSSKKDDKEKGQPNLLNQFNWYLVGHENGRKFLLYCHC